MKRLILICGDLAAGKSTLADRLAGFLQCACLKKDVLKEILSDEIGFRNREENQHLSRGAIAAMTHFFGQIAPTGADLILESNFHAPELPKIKVLADAYGYAVTLIKMTGDPRQLYDRFQKRLPFRHPTHVATNINSYDDYVRYLEESRIEDMIFSEHLIDATTHDEEEVFAIAKSFFQ